VRAFVGLDPITGRRKQASRTVHGGKREARRALNDLLIEIREQKVSGATATFSRLAEDWYRQSQQLGRAKSTLELYRSWLDKRILPALGDVPLSKLSPAIIDRFLGSLADSGLKPATISTIRSIVKAVCAQGVKWDWLAKNPADGTAVPKIPKVDRGVLSESEVEAIVRSAAQDDEDLACLIAVGAWTGARRGELCALRWSDLDVNEQMLNIERAFVPGKGGQSLTGTKTAERRRIPVPSVMAVFEAQRARKVAIFGGVEEDGYIFALDAGTTPPRAKNVTLFFTKHAKKVGVKARLHDLRHFAVTRAIAAGWDTKSAAAYFGHTPQVMLEVYSHGDPRAAFAAADSLPPMSI
jgi:integrase